MRVVMIACGSLAIGAMVACGDEPGGAVDAQGRPDAIVMRTVTVVMAVWPDTPRPLPETVPTAVSLSVVAPPQHGEIRFEPVGEIRYNGTGWPMPYVERVRAVGVEDPGLTVDLILVIGGAVFTGAFNGDAGFAPNWDDATGSLEDAPWVFVREAPIATVPADAARTADVLIDGATVRVDDLAVTGARFTCTGLLEPPPGVPRSAITITDGTATGLVPLLIARRAVTLGGDVLSQRVIVQPGGTLTVDGGHHLETGAGDSFVTAGGTLVIADGSLSNGHHLDVAGTLRTTAATSELFAAHVDVRGTLALERGRATLASFDLSRAQGVTVGDTQHTIVDGANGNLRARGDQSFASLALSRGVIIPDAPIHARGALTYAAATQGDVIADGGTTVTAESQIGHLTTPTLGLEANLTVFGGVTTSGTVVVPATRRLIFDSASVSTIGGDLRVDGRLTNAGTTTVAGTLDFGPGAILDNTGMLVAAQCRAGGVAGAPPCP